MPAMSKLDEQSAAIKQVLGKEQKLTASDLQTLRQNTGAAQSMSSKSDYFVFRMEIELIDAIRALDDTSAKLIERTNSLTRAILWLTVAAVALATIEILITVFGSK